MNDRTTNDSAAARRGPVWLGPLALLVLPIAGLIDTALAWRCGWRADSAALLKAAVALDVAVVGLVLLALLLPPLRRRIVAGGGKLALLVAGGVLGFVLSEVALRYVFHVPRFHRRSPGLVLRFRPDPFEMYKVSGEETRATYNSLGIRGEEPGETPRERRILAIGGSTTECLYLDDPETWPALVQQHLRKDDPAWWVGNAGHGDLATGHHLRWVTRDPLPGECGCWLFLVGANDLMRYLLRLDSGECPPPLWYRTATLHVLQELWNVRLEQGIVWDPTGERLLGVHRRGFPIPPWPEGEPTWDDALAGYRQRLLAIIEQAEQLGVRPVFISQPVLWDDYLSPDAEKRLCIARVEPYPRDWDYLTAANLRTVMDRYNETLEEVCQDSGAGFIDAALTLSGQEELFFDDYHLNEEGCVELAELVGGWLREHLDTDGTAE